MHQLEKNTGITRIKLNMVIEYLVQYMILTPILKWRCSQLKLFEDSIENSGHEGEVRGIEKRNWEIG